MGKDKYKAQLGISGAHPPFLKQYEQPSQFLELKMKGTSERLVADSPAPVAC